MSESAIRAQIYTIMGGIANIGQVYDYERWADNWADFINLFKDSTGKILGWEISRKAPISDIMNEPRVHTYSIKGYMGVSDANASEKVFNALIELIAATFRVNLTLNNAALGHDLIQVTSLDTRTFASVLSHAAELTLTVYEQVY